MRAYGRFEANPGGVSERFGSFSDGAFGRAGASRKRLRDSDPHRNWLSKPESTGTSDSECGYADASGFGFESACQVRTRRALGDSDFDAMRASARDTIARRLESVRAGCYNSSTNMRRVRSRRANRSGSDPLRARNPSGAQAGITSARIGAGSFERKRGADEGHMLRSARKIFKKVFYRGIRENRFEIGRRRGRGLGRRGRLSESCEPGPWEGSRENFLGKWAAHVSRRGVRSYTHPPIWCQRHASMRMRVGWARCPKETREGFANRLSLSSG